MSAVCTPEVRASGAMPRSCNANVSAITVTSGSSEPNNDFLNFQQGTKSGTKFNDLQADGFTGDGTNDAGVGGNSYDGTDWAVTLGPGAVTWARRPAMSRRHFLRAGAWALAGLGFASSVGMATLSEHFVAEELAGYDRIDATLARLR